MKLPDAARRPAASLLARVLLATAAALAAAVAFTSTPAHAAGGTGDGDPHESGCDNGAITLKSLTMKDGSKIAGYLYLRYSPSCQSEWVMVTYSSGYVPMASFWLQNESGTDLYTSDLAPWQGKTWTWMYRDMLNRACCGGVQMYHTNGIGGFGTYFKWFYVGCA